MFETKVDLRKRDEMVEFLSSHFRYWTMSSLNRYSSYANCVKLHGLELTSEERDVGYGMLYMPEPFEDIEDSFREWSAKHDNRWAIAFNGRSNGYLVLFERRVVGDYLSQCDTCFRYSLSGSPRRCIASGCNGTMWLLDEPKPKIETYMGSVDAENDFAWWDICDLQDRARLVMDFDRACDKAVDIFRRYCRDYRIVEEEIAVLKTVKVLKPVDRGCSKEAEHETDGNSAGRY